ncbi:hypothetical protein [Actinomadura violacea]|uniref:RlpA-like protein double-psi beta-barrel domain-containing protein n=1 Tax=Actinomadura violacea TaxID=2819934 RepID=A0ABS3RW32_9ACTN|nr:hypothetical protein [Actinomadura violacea]MBO2460969.1 hypothetical protein [Actinomadura violacea]
MAQPKQINAIAVGAVGAGLVFIWSGLRGSSVLSALQDIIRGNRPSGSQVHGISAQSGPTGDASTGVTGPGKQYCASVFGGPSDPGTGSRGYHGDNLNGTMSYAELGMGKAMGNLPYRQKLRITYKGKSVVAEKLDIGAGGAGCGGHARGIDLWYQTAQALGFDGLGVVSVEPVS